MVATPLVLGDDGVGQRVLVLDLGHIPCRHIASSTLLMLIIQGRRRVGDFVCVNESSSDNTPTLLPLLTAGTRLAPKPRGLIQSYGSVLVGGWSNEGCDQVASSYCPVISHRPPPPPPPPHIINPTSHLGTVAAESGLGQRAGSSPAEPAGAAQRDILRKVQA